MFTQGEGSICEWGFGCSKKRCELRLSVETAIKEAVDYFNERIITRSKMLTKIGIADA